MKLLVGLGNPGESYAFTRHNAGFLVVEHFCTQITDSTFSYNKKFDAQITPIIPYNSTEVIIVKPQTFMNLSGKSIKTIASFYKIKPEDILVIHDEIDLVLGDIKYKDGGGHAGHNGLKSIIQELGTNVFKRIRLGIGRPNNDKMSVSDYVLGKFKKEQRNTIEEKYDEINTLIDNFIAKNLQNKEKQIL